MDNQVKISKDCMESECYANGITKFQEYRFSLVGFKAVILPVTVELCLNNVFQRRTWTGAYLQKKNKLNNEFGQLERFNNLIPSNFTVPTESFLTCWIAIDNKKYFFLLHLFLTDCIFTIFQLGTAE